MIMSRSSITTVSERDVPLASNRLTSPARLVRARAVDMVFEYMYTYVTRKTGECRPLSKRSLVHTHGATMPTNSVFARQQFGQRMGFGERPALLIVDFQVGFSDPAIFGGGNIADAVGNTVHLLQRARDQGLPIAHTRIVYAGDGSDTNVHCLKVPRLHTLTEQAPSSQFVPELEPLKGEIVIRKRLPSAFFGTDLAGMLIGRSVDTLIVAGCTTSGCVRASVVDAMCHGLRPMVVSDCVGDRAEEPHAASLFDLGKKYADIMTRAEVFEALDRLHVAA
jgi:maleamate amidohydrolase